MPQRLAKIYAVLTHLPLDPPSTRDLNSFVGHGWVLVTRKKFADLLTELAC